MRRRRKQVVTECAGFIIRHRDNGTFQADCMAHGKRARQVFATLAEAQTFCEMKRTEAANHGAGAFDLGNRDRLELVEARRRLRDVPLAVAVDFYLRHHPQGETRTVSALVDEYVSAPGRRGRNRQVQRRPDSIDRMSRRLDVFARTFGGRKAHEIARADLEAWLDGSGWHGLNRLHYMAGVTALFNFAVRKGYVGMNPAAELERPEIHRTPPVILTPRDVTALLRHAATVSAPLACRLALHYFAGLRPRELDRLTWASVSLENSLVTVDADVAKVQGQRRNVELAPAAVAWLARYGGSHPEGRVWPYSATHLRVKLADVETAAGVEHPQDGGRHAFASYHLAAHQNAPATAEALGHSDVKLLRNVYANIVARDGKPITKAVADRFWNIRPEDAAGVIQFPKARTAATA